MLQARASDFAQLARYRADDERLAQNPAVVPRIVFFGDSITEDWITKDWISHSRIPPSANREYINRGISGQTTAQLLLRFRQDGARQFLGIIGTPLRHLGKRHHHRERVVYRVLDLAEFLLQLDQFFLGNTAVVFTHVRRFRVEKRDFCA